MRFRKEQPILYTEKGNDLFPTPKKAHFYGYNGNQMARIWIFKEGRKTVPLSTIKPRETVTA